MGLWHINLEPSFRKSKHFSIEFKDVSLDTVVTKRNLMHSKYWWFFLVVNKQNQPLMWEKMFIVVVFSRYKHILINFSRYVLNTNFWQQLRDSRVSSEIVTISFVWYQRWVESPTPTSAQNHACYPSEIIEVIRFSLTWPLSL